MDTRDVRGIMGAVKGPVADLALGVVILGTATAVRNARFLNEAGASELVHFLADRGIRTASVACNARLGWVALVETPWHESPVPMRSWDDIYCLLQELTYTGEWDGV